VVVADADLLSDDVWVQMDQQSGVRRAFAHNGPLIIGLLERIAGNPAIATLRSQGAFRRPFALVEALRTAAQLARLQQTVNEYRKELCGVQYGLRSDREELGSRLLVINVIAWPVIVALAAGIWCWIAARRIDRTPMLEPSE